jgi:hypothetical protein
MSKVTMSLMPTVCLIVVSLLFLCGCTTIIVITNNWYFNYQPGGTFIYNTTVENGGIGECKYWFKFIEIKTESDIQAESAVKDGQRYCTTRLSETDPALIAFRQNHPPRAGNKIIGFKVSNSDSSGCVADTICTELGDIVEVTDTLTNVRRGDTIYATGYHCSYSSGLPIPAVHFIEILVPPYPAPEILQDSLTLVELGVSQAYVPFAICNSDVCDKEGHSYNYRITSKGDVGAAIDQSGTIFVPSGGCKDIYGIIDASAATICDWDTLTILSWWTPESEALYDTCVQVIHVIEPQSVPLFTVPVVTILVLALILAAAVFMRRRAVSRA